MARNNHIGHGLEDLVKSCSNLEWFVSRKTLHFY